MPESNPATDPEWVMVKLANGAHHRVPADHPAVKAEGTTVLKRPATLPNGDAEPSKTVADLGNSGSGSSSSASAASASAEKK